MDAPAAQLRRQIDETRAAMDAQLTQLEQHVSQMPAAILEQTVGAPVRGVQETVTRATTLLHQYPWLIIAGGALLGYQLRHARARPVRPVQSPPQRAAVAPRSERPSAAHARPAVYDNPQPPPARAADPPAPGEPTRAVPPDPRRSSWMFGGLGATQLARRVIAEIQDDDRLGRVFEIAWNILRWPVIVALLIGAMALLYYVAPDVEQRWQWITPGSACAVIGWLLASLGFSFYVNRFGSYNDTYGSIGAVIVLLTWMYVSGLFILIGGEINAEIEHAAQDGKAPGEKQLSRA